MAAGFRSFLGIWIGGVAVGVTPPAVLCPCPEYGHDQTLTSLVAYDQTLVDNFGDGQTLSNAFQLEGNAVNNFTCQPFDVPSTLSSAWKKRKGCE